jgi:hypothetical protein
MGASNFIHIDALLHQRCGMQLLKVSVGVLYD